MEKKQKIAIKKWEFVIAIALGSNYQGVIVGGSCRGGNCLVVIFLVGNYRE